MATEQPQGWGGPTLLFRCLEPGFVTTAPAMTRYQKGRSINSSRWALAKERRSNWIKSISSGFPRSDMLLTNEIKSDIALGKIQKPTGI
jgi:hypothetical protein